MKAALWGIALGSLCLLQAAADITVQPNFNVNKIVGKWYEIGTTVQHDDVALKHENGYQVTLTAAKDGGLYFHGWRPEMNCQSKVFFFAMGEKPGIYTVEEATYYMVKTDYKNYLFMYDEEEQSLHLFGRKQRVSKAVKEAFRKLAAEINSPLNIIIYFKKAAPCRS